MPAAQLAKAEVMLAAPARYHVRGMAINIVTKDYVGTNRLSGQIIGGLQQSKYALVIYTFLCKEANSDWMHSINIEMAIRTMNRHEWLTIHWVINV